MQLKEKVSSIKAFVSKYKLEGWKLRFLYWQCLQGKKIPFYFKHCANKFALVFEYDAFLFNKRNKTTF